MLYMHQVFLGLPMQTGHHICNTRKRSQKKKSDWIVFDFHYSPINRKSETFIRYVKKNWQHSLSCKIKSNKVEFFENAKIISLVKDDYEPCLITFWIKIVTG